MAADLLAESPPPRRPADRGGEDVSRRAVGEWVMASRRPRPGHHSVTPRIFVDDPEALARFLHDVFGASGDVEPGRPAEIRIGDSLVMVSGTAERAPMAAFLYVYVEDADVVYARAIAAGAHSLEAPLDTPYGDRRAMVRDPFGNIFQIAHQLTVR